MKIATMEDPFPRGTVIGRQVTGRLGFYGGTSLPDTFGLGRKLTLRCVRSIAAHTLSTAAPLLVAWPDLIVAGLPNDTAHCQSPRSSRTTVYSTPRYSIDRPIGNANLPSRTPPQWSILLALRKLNGQRPVRPIADGSARYLQGLQDTSHAFSMRLYLWRAGSSVARSAS